jgi:hypothetical protein
MDVKRCVRQVRGDACSGRRQLAPFTGILPRGIRHRDLHIDAAPGRRRQRIHDVSIAHLLVLHLQFLLRGIDQPKYRAL